jgi:hypothetical protein
MAGELHPDVTLDDAPPTPSSVVDLLNAIPGAWERIERGREQAHAGDTVPIDFLCASRSRTSELDSRRNA